MVYLKGSQKIRLKKMTKITHGFANVGAVNLHYAECGAGKSDLVIMLHGFPEFWYTWRKQLPELGKDFHAVAPDMRGYNLSDKPENPEDYKIENLVPDIVGLARHFGHEKFYLVSHDWGAAVAWAVAIACRDQIKGLIVLNGAHPYIFAKLLEENEKQIAHSKYMTDFRDDGIEKKLLADNFSWLWNWTFAKHHKQGLLSDADRAAYIKAWSEPNAIKASLNYYRMSPLKPRPIAKGVASLGLKPERFMVHVPTYVIWGEKDHALMPENLDGIEDLVPDIKIKRLPEVSHWVTHEEPELVLAEISRFIKELKARKRS
jgi:epoxide hydrolase 4